ncbi:MAG: 2,4-dihydroxyhept-2-ene-1,7-dioic acid aldolase [Alphaproteobacteria bacterium]|nr:2,4-dihydroxyhept-2-ene-1,7-dioic acid aldolase [Alphaproteobacteria bacterium]
MAKRAAKGRPRLGFWLMTSSQAAVEIAALAGFELVILDMEHGAISDETADALIPLAKGLGLTVYSRVAAAARVPIQKALDSGADGVIIPQIQGAEHAAEVTAFAKYPPRGTRGLGFSRIDGYGGAGSKLTERENRRTFCYPMIETPGALADAAAIAALPTVDGLFLGPSDLSLTRGRGMLQLTDADFADAKKVAEAAYGAGKRFTLSGASDKSWAFACKVGADFIGAADDLSALKAGFGATATKRLGAE